MVQDIFKTDKILDVNAATIIDCGAVGAETTQKNTGELKNHKSRGNQKLYLQ